MDLKIKTDDAQLNVDVEADCTTMEIWNVNHWNVITLNDGQVKQLKEFLNER